jgi:riboflavin synthase
MFTGIVEEIGIAKEISRERLAFQANRVVEGTKTGDSMAVNGVCLTVVSVDNRGFAVDVMPETLRCTNLGRLRYGDRVNLERALPLGGRLGGHLVLGHVDETGGVLDVTREKGALIMKISAAAELMPYMVAKGFIAVDGASLTIVNVENLSFVVSLVGYTMENTTLGKKRPGDVINLEVDVIARYIENLKEQREQSLSIEFLRQYGFVGAIGAE